MQEVEAIVKAAGLSFTSTPSTYIISRDVDVDAATVWSAFRLFVLMFFCWIIRLDSAVIRYNIKR